MNHDEYITIHHQYFERFEQKILPLFLNEVKSVFTIKELIILDRINNYPDDTFQEFSTALGMTKSAFSNMVRSMQSKSYLSKNVDQNDHRKYHISLTEYTQSQLQASAKVVEIIRKQVISTMGRLELIRFVQVIVKISQALSDRSVLFHQWRLDKYDRYFQTALNELFLSINSRETEIVHELHPKLLLKDMIILQSIYLEKNDHLSTLAKQLSYNVNTIYKILGKLEKLHLVHRSPSKSDARTKQYQLTPIAIQGLQSFIGHRMNVLKVIQDLDTTNLIEQTLTNIEYWFVNKKTR